MSRLDRPAPRSGDLPLAIGILAALFASILPLLRVVSAGSWVLGVLVVSASVLGVGYIARRYRLPAVAVSLIEAVVWIVLVTLIFLRDTALLGVIPTPETAATIPSMLRQAGEEIALGVAPLTASTALAFLITGSVGLLAIVLDHVVITARLPLVAAVGVIAVSLIPSIAVPDDIDVLAFALLAGAILFLVRVETRTRLERVAVASAPVHQEWGPASVAVAQPRATSTSAMALGIGAIAVVVALVVTPLLPPPEARAGGLGVSGVAINPTLRLGDDLRRPSPLEVLTVRTTAPGAPYLRAVTLSSFNGRIWEPDRRDVVPLDSDSVFGAGDADPDIAVVDYDTQVQIQSLQTQWLPVPFPAVAVEGLPDAWSAMPYNRTVIGETTTSSGLSYDVHTEVPRPTLEQIRARPAAGIQINGGFDRSTATVPPGLPPEVEVLADQVTADATTDYDKLVALQSWFRGSQFRYSLEAPVEQSFDGSGLRAVAKFLEVKAGYCVHFASAFALMARTLGMSSRIVVGYLPGTVPSGVPSEVQTRYSVSSSQLHSWPEVYFSGIGWVPFEPTKTLGTPTAFVPAASGDSGGANGEDPLAPGATASATPTTAPGADDPGLNDATSGTVTSTAHPLPWSLGVLGVLLALLIPGLVREVRRRRQQSAARGGDAAAAWMLVQDVAIDIGVPVPGSDTPRAFGGRLVMKHGAPRDRMQVLIDGIERASYSPAGLDRASARDMADAAAAVRSALLRSVDTGPRLQAILLPRSLVVRPGSMYAGAPIPTG